MYVVGSTKNVDWAITCGGKRPYVSCGKYSLALILLLFLLIWGTLFTLHISLSGPLKNAKASDLTKLSGQAFSTSGYAPATVVAERPLYFNFEGDPGGTDVLGYTGG